MNWVRWGPFVLGVADSHSLARAALYHQNNTCIVYK